MGYASPDIRRQHIIVLNGQRLLAGASLMGSATLCFSRRTQRRGCQRHRCQNRHKPGARLRTDKARGCRRPVRPGQAKVGHGGAALPLARPSESAPWMAAEGSVALTLRPLGPGALADGYQPLGRVLELVLGLTPPGTPGPTGVTPRGAPPLGQLAPRWASA